MDMELPAGYTDFSVRPVRAGDEVRLSDFYRRLSAQSRFFFEPYTDISVDAMRKVVERAVRGDDLSFVALNSAGSVFAHFFFMNVSQDIPHLGIGLRDEYQGLGLGSLLLVYLMNVGKRVLRKHTVGLTVMKENHAAVRLYRRMGFEIVGNVSFRSENDSYEMRLHLS